MLDWKGKKSSSLKINERAYISYIKIAKIFNLNLIIATAKIESNKITAFKFIFLPDENAVERKNKEWDGNYSIIFKEDKAKKPENIKEFLDKL